MISVIVLTYNDPRRLRLCLYSLLDQTRTDFELLVVHDGGDRTINLPVYEEIRRHGRDITELWLGPESTDSHESAARNLGLRHAHGERVLFVDGDCILSPNIVAEHAAFAANKVLVNGARVHLPEKCLEWLQPEDFGQLEQHTIERDKRYWVGTPRYIGLRDQLLAGERIVLFTHYEQVWAFQYSVPTVLARQIGGFNESFVNYGGEDQEFAARMERAGALLLGRFDLISYHLDHPSRAICRSANMWMKRVEDSLRQLDLVRNGGPLPGPFEILI